jgi:predicted nucleic acid-binding protein
MIPEGALTDTGPLFALVDPINQPEQSRRCVTTMLTLPVPLVTTWPCLSEAMHLAGRTEGWQMQQLIAELVSVGTLRLHTPSEDETARILALMAQYQDKPMDLADASLVALAETVGYTRIFSIDSDFYVYRLVDGTALEVMPGPMKKGR